MCVKSLCLVEQSVWCKYNANNDTQFKDKCQYIELYQLNQDTIADCLLKAAHLFILISFDVHVLDAVIYSFCFLNVLNKYFASRNS